MAGDQLYQRLNSSPATAQRSLPWSSDITYGDRPVSYYPFVVTNTSGSTCTVDGARSAAAVTRAGATLDLVPGSDGAGQGNASQRETALPPKTSTGFALGLSDTGTRCRYLRQFTVGMSGVAAPVTVPVTGMTGGAAVCGNRAATLTALGGH